MPTLRRLPGAEWSRLLSPGNTYRTTGFRGWRLATMTTQAVPSRSMAWQAARAPPRRDDPRWR